MILRGEDSLRRCFPDPAADGSGASQVPVREEEVDIVVETDGLLLAVAALVALILVLVTGAAELRFRDTGKRT